MYLEKKKREEEEGVLKMKCPPQQFAEDRLRLIMCPPDTLKFFAVLYNGLISHIIIQFHV
jgi:hypothetical protein